MSSLKRTKAILASLEAQGCILKRTNAGWWIGFPTGGSTALHKTQSDHRAEQNFRAIVRRHGMAWPFD